MALRRSLAGTALLLALLAAWSIQGCAGNSSGDSCGPRACNLDKDCGFGQVCAQHTCQRRHTFCASESVSMNDRGEWLDCDVYRCDQATGQCLRSADSTADCRNHALWDAQSYTCICPAGGCVDSAPPPTYDLSCYATCAHDADCASGQMCWKPQGGAARCVPRGNYCGVSANGVVSVQPYGSPGSSGDMARDEIGCGLYACNGVTGQCLTDCTNSDQCRGSSCILCDYSNGCSGTPQVCETL